MKKKYGEKSGVDKSARPAALIGADRTQRPWKLLLLGVMAVGLVAFLQINGRKPSSSERPEDKVYSAAADTFDRMVVPSEQAGLLEPAGVEKPLRLFGVKVGGNPREGLAVLGPAEASSRTYVAGALLENGARLTDLHSDHVVLTRDGRSYRVYLSQKGKGDVLEAKSTAGLTVGGFKTEPPPIAVPAVRVTDAIRVAPAYEGGQVVGFQVYPGAKPGQMEKWGLASGDVLVSMSGQPLNTPEQVESVMEQLAQGESVHGEVRRGGERVSVTLDGAMLVASRPSETPPPMMP
jgi:general secretion pathway protein C